MTTTYELYTNDNGTPKLVGGKAPAIVDRVEALETSVGTIEGTLNTGVVTSVNGNTGALTPEQTGCLPLSGGTMTGNLILSGADRGLFHDNTDGVTIVGGGTGTTNGGSFYAIGETNSTRPGYFVATARTSDVAGVQLVGKPDGTLTWGGKHIERVNSSGNGWIRYENGLQICWGHASQSTVTFSMPFKQYPTVIASANAADYSGGYAVTNPSLTGFSIYCVGSSSWFAIGVWK